MISQESLAEVNKVTGSAVKKAAAKIKPGKADVSGSFTSHVINLISKVSSRHITPIVYGNTYSTTRIQE